MDWTSTSYGEFLEAVEAHNEQAQLDKSEPASEEFRALMKERFRRG